MSESSKGKPPGAPAENSLDFTAPKPAKPAVKPPAPAAARRKKPPPASAKPSGSRKTFVMLLGAIAVAAVIAFALKDDPPQEPEPPKSASVKGAAPPAQAPTPPKAAQPYPPPVQTAPLAGSAPAEPSKLERVRAMPPEFLKAVQGYNTKPGYKSIALALDIDGKWAYGSIAGAGTQPGANDGALAECARFALKSGARSACKLFAVGDKVVW